MGDRHPGGAPGGPLHVVVSNVYADDNKGGAAITIALVTLIRDARPGCRVTLVPVPDTHDRRDDPWRFTRAAVGPVAVAPPLTAGRGPLAGGRLAARLLANVASGNRLCRSAASDAVATADVVIGKGGHALRGKGSVGSALGLLSTLHPLLLAARLRRRAVVHAVTIGPYDRRDPGRLVARWVLRRCTLVQARGERSAAEALALGVEPSRVERVPDVVFGWPPPAARSSGGPPLPEGIAGLGPFAACTIRSVPGVADAVTLDFFAQLVRWVRDDRGLTPVVVAQDVGPRAADERLAEALSDRLGGLARVSADLAPQELMDLYGRAELVIGGRTHSAIFALVGGTLGFPIDGPAHGKAREILDEVGAGDLVLVLPAAPDAAGAAQQAERQIAAVQERSSARLADLSDRIVAARAEVCSSIGRALGA